MRFETRCRPGLKPAPALALILVLATSALFASHEAAIGAEAQTFRALNPDSALAETLRGIAGEALSLDRAVTLALANATAVREAEAASAAAQGAFLREKGAFDPELFAEASSSETQTPSSSPFMRPDVTEDKVTAGSAGARMLLPFGTSIEASLDADRTDTNSEFAAIDPEYRADARLEIRQPLLSGFGPGTSAARSAAERGIEAAAAAHRDARLATRAQVEAAYWALYAAERDLAVQRLIVEQAQALLEQARLKADAGLVGPNEVANARVFLAGQSLAALDFEERLDGLSDALASLIGERPARAARFHPADEPPERFAAEELDDVLQRCLSRNEQLNAAAAARRSLEERLRGAKWNAYPRLDLVGSVGGGGLAGEGREVVFGSDTLRTDASGGYGDAIGEALARDYPNWSVGLELSFPIPLRAGRGERMRLDAETARARHQEEAVRRALEERVRAAHRELQGSQNRLDLAREGVAASFEQVRIGIIEYNNGRNTAFELVRLGADLAASQQRLSQSLVRAARAAAELQYLSAGLSEPSSTEASDR